MTDIHHLEVKLKSLKLSGMLDTLDLRINQAQRESLGFIQFLEFLLEDEVQRRVNKKLAARVKKARFEEQKTLEEFNFSFNPKIPAQYINDMATCQFIERKESIVLCGQVGVGKTHLAQALGHQACRMGYKVLFTKSSRFLSDIGGGRADGTRDERMRLYLKPDLLILDDFALKEFSTLQAEDLYELIDEHCRKGSLVITSNRAPEDWYALFPNPVIAESALDRLMSRAHIITLSGKSYRSLLRPAQPQPLAKEVANM